MGMDVYGGTLIPRSAEPVAIVAVDRQFSRDDFLEFARSVHRNVHAAVPGGDLSSVRALTSDALRTSLLDRRSEAQWARPVDRLDHTSILDAAHGDIDRITVRFGAVIGGREVVEDWVFARDAAAYPHLRGVVPTVCASCSAPLSTDERGNCRYCGTHLVGVGGEWRVENVLPPRIVDPARAPSAPDTLGPEHDLDPLLEFARSIYANVHKATSSRTVGSIHAVLTTRMRAHLESNPDDHCWGVPIHRIDAVTLVGVQRGALDVITVRIEAVTEEGPFVEDWTFERPGSLPGRAGPVPTTCPFCGAPVALDQSGKCTYCRTHLLGVAGDWRLADAIQPSTMGSHPVVIRAMQSRLGRWMILLFILGALAAVIALIAALTR